MSKNILVIGAGLSSSYLIKYLCEEGKVNQWKVTVADANPEQATKRIAGFTNAHALKLNIEDETSLDRQVSEHDLVISLLPPTMHIAVAKKCLTHRKHLITASYITPEMQQLHVDALKANVLFLNECGLDPGIDHLSAMQLIHRIQQAGGVITTFKSFCGGLVAPEFDNNPWNYKFTWNPRNVVLAGQATAKYLQYGELKFIPPSRIFTQTESVEIKGLGSFESYANRDSLSYIKPYGIESAHTVLRGTLRKKGFCESWNHLVKFGLTDDTYTITDASKLTYRDLVSALTPGYGVPRLETRISDFLDIEKTDEAFKKLEWLGLTDDDDYIKLNEGTPAQLLQVLLQQKWKLNKGDLDMIVMHHKIEYEMNKQEHRITSSLVVKGEDETYTAMAKTVGLPMAIAAKLLLTGKIISRGVLMPTHTEFYEPILTELAEYGVAFEEQID